MEDQKRYDWEPSVRKLGETEMLPETAWQEEWQISPDCESFAAVSALEDGTFTVRLNGALWETRTDKMYNCQFAPDGRLTALSQSDGEWAIVVDDAESEEHADYLWGTRFNKAGTIAVPMQTGMEYGMLVDGAPWEQLYTAATDFVLSETGKTAAVVQTAGLGQADLEGFSKGIYTIAVDGQAWEECYLNAWSPCFDREGHRVASTVRVTPYEYTISINGQRWSETYPCAWEPIFEPKSGDVIAPIRKEGKWGLARNGSLFWKPMFAQCWAPQAAATDGEYIWAVTAPSYGAFTVASALMSSQALEQALLDPKQSVKLTQTTKNIMSVNVPVYDFQTQTRSDADIYPYGFAATSGELDTAVDALGKVFRKMLKLAEVEKSAQLMAEEIEKTRRRVNALEYVVIPNTQDAIRYITMKLDENDRATTTRLMKVKDMLLQQSIEEQRQRDAEVLERFREA